MSEWRRLTGNANDGGVPSAAVVLLSSAPGKATLVLRYWNVIDGLFVEDEARQVVTAVNPPLLPDYNRDGAIDAQDEAGWVAETDTNGIFVAEHRLNEKFSVGIDKEGYFHSHDEINYFGMSAEKRLSIVKDGKWQPYASLVGIPMPLRAASFGTKSGVRRLLLAIMLQIGGRLP